jgi:MFS family permease
MNPAILLVAICAAIIGISYGMYAPLVPVFSRTELLADYSQVGIIGMANYLPYMFAPLFVGMVLDRTNKSYILASGIGLASVSVFLLSSAQSIPEVMFYRLLAGIAHALFWPSSEVLISSNSEASTRVKGIAIFTAAWVAGFMVGPLAGNVVLDAFDFRVLFQASAAVSAAAVLPSILLWRYGRPLAEAHELRSQSMSIIQMGSAMAKYPAVSAVLLYYAVTFGVILSVYPAYMEESSLSSQHIEYLFFVFGAARFTTLYFVPRISRHGTLGLALAVAATAIGMLVAYLFNSILAFGISLVLIGAATSVFYPVTFSMVTRNTPAGQMGQKLGAYEAMFGIGWAIGPVAVGFSSDSFGSSTPYLAFFVIGAILAVSLAFFRRR